MIDLPCGIGGIDRPVEERFGGCGASISSSDVLGAIPPFGVASYEGYSVSASPSSGSGSVLFVLDKPGRAIMGTGGARAAASS